MHLIEVPAEARTGKSWNGFQRFRVFVSAWRKGPFVFVGDKGFGEEVRNLKKSKKFETVETLTAKLQKSQAAIITDYRGLTVAEIGELRRQLRKLNVDYNVTKNTLLRMASRRLGLGALEGILEGPTAIAFCYGDVVAPAKALSEYARTSKVFSLKAGFMSGHLISAAQVTEMANLPPKEILMARVLGGIQAPASNVLGMLNAPVRGLLTVLQARAGQLQGT